MTRPRHFTKTSTATPLMSQALVTMTTTIKELYVTPTLASLLKLKREVPCIVR